MYDRTVSGNALYPNIERVKEAEALADLYVVRRQKVATAERALDAADSALERRDGRVEQAAVRLFHHSMADIDVIDGQVRRLLRRRARRWGRLLDRAYGPRG